MKTDASGGSYGGEREGGLGSRGDAVVVRKDLCDEMPFEERPDGSGGQA